jgi:GntR family transcriptional regulator, transcriptional repressor for pyruvate dehydrogenase complex
MPRMRKPLTSSQPRADNLAVTTRLRDLILSQDDGAFIGSEDDLTKTLSASAPTMRQAARILEREGLLRVKRGMGGGYYGLRPTYGSVEERVGEHLRSLEVSPAEVMALASLLWVEAVRLSAAVNSETARCISGKFRKKVLSLRPTCSFDELFIVEQAIRKVVFDLIERPYFELIFRINGSFNTETGFKPSRGDGTAAHAAFVEAWKKAKLIELDGIALGDTEVASAAAHRVRTIWERRLTVSA